MFRENLVDILCFDIATAIGVQSVLRFGCPFPVKVRVGYVQTRQNAFDDFRTLHW